MTEKSASALAWPATRACEKAKLIRGCYPDSCKVAKAGPTDIAFRGAEAAVTKACDRCHVNEHVVSHVCVVCAAGYTNAANDDPNGADTTCSAVSASKPAGRLLGSTLG